MKKSKPKIPVVELKGLKHMAALSEETFCFSATVYVDGKRAFTARNDGHGGCDMYDRVKGQSPEEFEKMFTKVTKTAEEHSRKRKDTCFSCDGTKIRKHDQMRGGELTGKKAGSACDECNDNGFSLPLTGENTVEYLISYLVGHELSRRDLTRLLKKKVVTFKDGECYTSTKPLSEPLLQAYRNKNKKVDPGKPHLKSDILNDLPFDVALELFTNPKITLVVLKNGTQKHVEIPNNASAIRAYRATQDLKWCTCEETESQSVKYAHDGQCNRKECLSMTKHHWHCEACGGLTQIG